MIAKLLEGKRNWVLTGDAGCGKSEIAVNLAFLLRDKIEKGQIKSGEVHFFDLDQTKPLFRSREAAKVLEAAGIKVHWKEQFFDEPTLPGGIEECLADEACYTVLDAGGGRNGMKMLGGFAGPLGRGDSKVYFIVNPYRPWFGELQGIGGTLSFITRMFPAGQVDIVSNPNLGGTTGIAEILKGHEQVKKLAGEKLPAKYLCVLDKFREKIQRQADIPVVPLKRYMEKVERGY